jgi:flagellar biosynthesis protein FlhA
MANATTPQIRPRPMAPTIPLQEQWARQLRNNRDVVMPLAIIGILMIMIVPMPPFLMDLLLTLSITSSLLMLFVGIYTIHPLDFSVFPSLLLVVTLFRLALNIATTRLILLHGNEGTAAAGRLIESFGQFVIGGNYVVGLIVFAILIVINFVVITKGAGRVAEVSARFTLDAMPGKQMSIDADLNAGIINQNDARERRRKIEMEADFYGAMDGASKFVRGDAIAGIIILVINIVGGLVIGMVQHGMDISEAARIYALLTVGDGLVSQIPSLIVSTAAGLVVTRAADEKNMGESVSSQFFLQPKALGVCSGILVVFGLMPGMPLLPFLMLAGTTGLAAWKSRQALIDGKAKERQDKQKEINAKKDKEKKAAEQPDVLQPLDLVSLEVGYGLIGLVDQEKNGDLLERIKSLRRQFAQEWGFIVPPVHIRDNLELRPQVYRILIKGCMVAQFEIRAGHLLAMAAEETDGKKLGGEPTTEPAFGLPAVWVPEKRREEAQAAGFTVVDASTIIATHLTEILKAYAHELLIRQETQNLLDALAKKFPKVVEGVVGDILPLGLIQKILQNLLIEHVSIRDLLTIIETMSERAPQVKDPDLLTEYVRQALARHIVQPYLSDQGKLQVMMLDREVEELLMRHTRATDQGVALTLDPESAQRILKSIEKAIDQWSVMLGTPILTCLPAVRVPLRKLTEKFFPQLVILSHNEIPAKIPVETLSLVGMSHATA